LWGDALTDASVESVQGSTGERTDERILSSTPDKLASLTIAPDESLASIKTAAFPRTSHELVDARTGRGAFESTTTLAAAKGTSTT